MVASRRRTPDDVLALLALLFLLRCLLDPVDNAYYHVPFLLALVAWEGLTRRGPPVVSLLSSAAIYYTIYKAGWTDDVAARNALYLLVDGAGRPVADRAALPAVAQAAARCAPGRCPSRAGTRDPLSRSRVRGPPRRRT